VSAIPALALISDCVCRIVDDALGRSGLDQGRVGGLRPSADHCSDHVIGRSIKRLVDRTRLHPRRPSRYPPSHLHASPRRDPLQYGPEGQVQPTHQRRKASQGRPHSCHAKVDPPCKRPPQGQSNVDPKTRLIKTDTLAAGSPCSKERTARAMYGAGPSVTRIKERTVTIVPIIAITAATIAAIGAIQTSSPLSD
jgi:hypothetical protein